MTHRRDLIMGAAALVAAGTAYGLKPRRKLNLMGSRKMASIIPTSFGTWASEGSDGLVKPETEGKLAARLYSEMVSRIYVNAESGDSVMMLVAYGDTQSDLLQLHRPESCYPAVGFNVTLSKEATVSLAGGKATLPGRRVVAEKSDFQESIVYWTRLGEYLPASAGQQRAARLQCSFQGYIPDGGLFRFSTARTDAQAFPLVERFISELVLAVAPVSRRALIATELAKRL